MPPETASPAEELNRLLAAVVDPGWYAMRYPEVAAAGQDAVSHFVRFGAAERRDPNRFFDGTWYLAHYPDVAASGMPPLLHYLQAGAAELRDPHPRFDAPFYVRRHSDAAGNPLLYHLRIGLRRGYPTEQSINIRDYLPSHNPALPGMPEVSADVVIPICSGDTQTRDTIESVLADRPLPPARIIVVDDDLGEPPLSAWLQELAAGGHIHLLRNPRKLGFAACAKQGIDIAATHDVVLLRSGTVVFPGWLSRLAAHAASDPHIATVSPLCATVAAGVASLGLAPALLDEVCGSVNTARSVPAGAPAGNCTYIRRDALRQVGGMTDGAGPEADFCRRAAEAGWQNRLAYDIFVHRQLVHGQDLANPEDYPLPADNPTDGVATDPFEFALAAGLFRRSNLPVILMISHAMGGGVRRHIEGLVKRYRRAAHIVLLQEAVRGVALSLPALSDQPVLKLPSDRLDDLVLVLKSANLSRVHIHHQLHLDIDIRRLILRLDLPFDVTVHDYYAICPQINLLPWPEGIYCGEPSPSGCNACIADNSSHGAKDIVSWRREKAWQFIDADRVICPSADVKTRLARYGVAENAIVVPHESQLSEDWPIAIPPHTEAPLRIVLLGVLANHKGARVVASVVEAAEAGAIEIHLIGDVEPSFPKPAIKLMKITGKYQEQDLAEHLRKARPDVFWFPSSAPETYSYTLGDAIASGLPIVATKLGSFPERLAGRPNTWLVDHRASARDLLAVFEQVKARLRDSRPPPPPLRATADSDFYDNRYLAPITGRLVRAAPRPRIVVLPERSHNGSFTANAYIRLLQPLDHPAIGGAFDIVLADAETVFDDKADIIIIQHRAIPRIETADRLAAHARRIGAKLVFDLDDDLSNVSSNNPDAPLLRLQAKIVRRMLIASDAVWLSTQVLADRLAAIRPDAIVIENRLDERIWTTRFTQPPSWDDPVRILCMGASTHSRDFALIQPALTRLQDEYGPRIAIDILGMTGTRELPPGLNRIDPPPHANRSYPGFVNWLNAIQPRWHIGLAPLLDTPFNRGKSAIKALDYAALGLAILASDVPAYRGSIADGPAGQLVPNDHDSWHAALDWLIRDQSLRRTLAAAGRDAFAAHGTLLSQAEQRRAALRSLLPKPPTGLQDGAAGLTMAG